MAKVALSPADVIADALDHSTLDAAENRECAVQVAMPGLEPLEPVQEPRKRDRGGSESRPTRAVMSLGRMFPRPKISDARELARTLGHAFSAD